MREKCDLLISPSEINTADPGDYVIFSEEFKGEFLLLQEVDGVFYFLCSSKCDIEEVCRILNWYVVSKDKFNDRLNIGIGLGGSEHIVGEVYRCRDEDTLRIWRDILNFTFRSDFVPNFFPFDNHFAGSIILDGAPCYYIHEYYPVSRPGKHTPEQKKIANLVFRFKEGRAAPLMAKIFSLAISRLPSFCSRTDSVLIPVPASSRERHRQRFAAFSAHLSRRLGITDGYRAIWINEDRPQLKGSSEDRILHARFNKTYIEGKNVYLVDDILTTGLTFIQTKQKLEELSAKSVTGIFLGKTV